LHVDADVVSDVIAKIEEWFGKMMVTRGKKHTFLGMEAISDSNLTITHQSSTPAAKGLFDINNT
jgi:hypothetical protein